jgi:hypothetical protein
MLARVTKSPTTVIGRGVVLIKLGVGTPARNDSGQLLHPGPGGG